MPPSELRAHGRAGTALALFYILLWSSAFVPSRVLSRMGQPLWVLTIRFAIASVLMAAVVVTLGRPWPRTRAAWVQIAGYGLLANAVYLGCTYEALRHLSSGMGAIIASTNPLLLALVAPALLNESLTGRKIVGLLLGFGGVLVAMWARAGTRAARPGDVLLAFVGVVALVGSTLVFKRLRSAEDLLAANTVQLGTASVALLPLAVMLERAPHLPPTAEFMLNLAYLVLVMSLGATFLWFWLLRHGEASRVSAFYFLTPILGLGLGALLLGESVRPLDGLGLAAVAAGIVLVQSARGRAVPAAVEET
jgi:probable blue pigment (indigoidine) exporter